MTLDRLHDPRYDFPTVPGGVRRRYLVATTPRSGSTFLCLQMWRSGALGAPLEYLNFVRSHALAAELATTSLDGYLDALEARRTSPNGVFGVKVFLPHLLELRRRFGAIPSRLVPDHFIYLKRRDPVAQAVSMWRAEQTGAWASFTPEHRSPLYDRREISDRLAFLAWQAEAWDALFEALDVPVHRVDYEDLMEDPVACVGEVASALGVHLAGEMQRDLPPLSVQRDAITVEWIERFKAGG